MRELHVRGSSPIPSNFVYDECWDDLRFMLGPHPRTPIPTDFVHDERWAESCQNVVCGGSPFQSRTTMCCVLENHLAHASGFVPDEYAGVHPCTNDFIPEEIQGVL